MTEDLNDVIADERGQAAVLRANGHALEADIIERICDRVANSSEEYRRFLTEAEAELRSARSIEWLRGQFAQWESQGNAKKKDGRRYYRMVVIPQRANLSVIREEGRQIGMQKAG